MWSWHYGITAWPAAVKAPVLFIMLSEHVRPVRLLRCRRDIIGKFYHIISSLYGHFQFYTGYYYQIQRRHNYTNVIAY